MRGSEGTNRQNIILAVPQEHTVVRTETIADYVVQLLPGDSMELRQQAEDAAAVHKVLAAI